MHESDWLDFCQRWQDGLRASSSDAQLAVLLAYLPSLRSLQLDTEGDNCCGITLHMLHHYAGRKDSYGTRPILGSLTHRYVHSLDRDSTSMSQPAIQLRRIPTLSHFYGSQLGAIELEEDYCATDGSISSLVHLELGPFWSGPRELQSVLRQCACLETLVFSHNWQYEVPQVLTTSELVQAFNFVCHTLKSLYLNHHPFDEGQYPTEPFVGPVSLVEFPALTSLHISIQYLVGQPEKDWEHYDYTTWAVNATIPFYKRLPDSLEVLHILRPDDEEEFQRAVESLQEMIRMHRELFCLPHLRVVRFEAPFEGDGSAFGILAVQQEARIRLRKLDISPIYNKSWIWEITKSIEEWSADELTIKPYDYEGILGWMNLLSDFEFLEID